MPAVAPQMKRSLDNPEVLSDELSEDGWVVLANDSV
jgi:hypothetical protein